MILIITNKQDYTADFLILELKRRGISFARFNTEDFPQHIQVSVKINSKSILRELRIYEDVIDLNTITSIWYRRPIPSEPSSQIDDLAAREFVITESRETLEGLWRTLPCFWVSHPDKLRAAESKIYQLMVAASIGFLIPDTLVTNIPNQASVFYESHSTAVVYKPLRHSQVIRNSGINFIYTNLVNPENVKYFDSIKFSPTLLQNYIPKMLELRVTVVGQQSFAVELHSQEMETAQHDWRRGEILNLRHVPCKLPPEINEKCIALVHKLGLAFGAIDMILTPEGEYVFLEINPNGQWAWIEQMCPEVQISKALADLLLSKNL